MTSSAAMAFDFDRITEADRTGADDLAAICASLCEEIAAMEPIVSAAVMVAMAFRMKNDTLLVDALRRLSEAVEEFGRMRE